MLLPALLCALGCQPVAPPAPPPSIKMTQSPSMPPLAKRHFDYPASPPGSVVEQLHGVTVPDPYRWLEDASSA